VDDAQVTVIVILRNSPRNSRHRNSKSFSKTFGPPIFEIVPFVIVENAIKYAPPGTAIVVKFDENDDEIIIRFESLGPEITEREMSRIFERSYRGSAVRDSQRTGSGIGLFAAKTIVENHFGGKIFVNQFDASLLIDENTFWDTRFTVIVPVVRDETALKSKMRRS
jgi:signal transduction histidine kinase